MEREHKERESKDQMDEGRGNATGKESVPLQGLGYRLVQAIS